MWSGDIVVTPLRRLPNGTRKQTFRAVSKGSLIFTISIQHLWQIAAPQSSFSDHPFWIIADYVEQNIELCFLILHWTCVGVYVWQIQKSFEITELSRLKFAATKIFNGGTIFTRFIFLIYKFLYFSKKENGSGNVWVELAASTLDHMSVQLLLLLLERRCHGNMLQLLGETHIHCYSFYCTLVS